MEIKVTDLVEPHNKFMDSYKDQEQEIKWLQSKIADFEDRSCRNNIKCRGITESIQLADLNIYVCQLLRSLIPAATEHELIIDQAHCLPKPKYLKEEILINLIVKIHFFHIKEQAMLASQNAIQARCKLAPITQALREHQIPYR